MPKLSIFVLALVVFGLFLAAVTLFAYLTQAANIQIIPLQSLYETLDRVWGIGRAVVFLFVALIASIVAFFYRRELAGLSPRWLGGMFLFSTIGMVLGLLVHYEYACCDTPWIYYFGFPFSWAYGFAYSLDYQPISRLSNYLNQILSQLEWHMLPWNLFVNYLFWVALGFVIFSIASPPGRHRRPGSSRSA
jgi:hypothetical protein